MEEEWEGVVVGSWSEEGRTEDDGGFEGDLRRPSFSPLRRGGFGEGGVGRLRVLGDAEPGFPGRTGGPAFSECRSRT